MNEKRCGQSADFDLALARLTSRWPGRTGSITVDTARTRTHILDCPGDGGVPVVLLPGGGATAASWATVARRVHLHRLVAPDIPGDAGRTTLANGKLSSAQVHEWLDEILSRLGIDQLDLAGHSYGGWLALSYALARPGRVRRLSLIAPSMCFAPLSPRYIAHALPVLVRPSARSARRLITWETADCRPDPLLVDVYAAAADRRWGGVPRLTRPRPADLAGLDVTAVNLILASDDRSHDNSSCAANARRHLRHVTVTTVDEASHHSIVERGADVIASLLD